jgi:hypothetical protein
MGSSQVIVVPLWATRLTSAEDPAEPVHGRVALLVAGLSVAALAGLVLVVYDTALLYNLGKLGAELPAACLAAVAPVIARAIAARLPARSAGRGVDSIENSFSWFLVLFFAPALPVRYGIDFGARMVVVVGSVRPRHSLSSRSWPARASTGFVHNEPKNCCLDLEYAKLRCGSNSRQSAAAVRRASCVLASGS